jgi:hypothetical protein
MLLLHSKLRTKKKDAADAEMKHAVALAKEAARTNAQVKQHLESKGFSMPSITFDEEIKKSKASLAKQDKKTMIDQTKELAAMAAMRATKAALNDAQAHLKAAKLKFDQAKTSDCLNNLQNEKKCKDITNEVAKASSDVIRKQERFNRASEMLNKYKASLSKDMSEYTKQRQVFFKDNEKMNEHLESEVQRLQAIATMAKAKREQDALDGKLEEANTYKEMGKDASKAALKAAMELANRQLKFDHYNGKSALFTSTLDKSQINFESPTHYKWSKEQAIKFVDHELAACVHNTSIARDKVKALGVKVSQIGGDLADKTINDQMKQMLRGNLNLAASQYRSAQSELQKFLADELIARAKLMELSGQFYEFQKGQKSGDKQLVRMKSELEASRNTEEFLKMEKEKSDHLLEEKTKLVTSGIETIKQLSEGLDKVSDEKLTNEKRVKSLETEIKKANLHLNDRIFVRAAIRIEGTKELFTKPDANGTVMETAFIEAISHLVDTKKENIQITDVSDASLAKRRRRLQGNIRGALPSTSTSFSPLVDIRFKIFTPKPDAVVNVLKTKMPEFASGYGFKNSVLLENTAVVTAPQPRDQDSKSMTGATGGAQV